MNPEIFIDDFERTENSDWLQAILGRALIISTRFDSMCKAAAVHISLKNEPATILGNDDDTNKLFAEIVKRHKTLHSSIGALQPPKPMEVILYDANRARNAVAHDLAKGLTGCLNMKIDEAAWIHEVSDLIFDVAHGDIAISLAISALNRDPLPNSSFVSSYVERVIKWVVEK
jgi:hypothetical protein